MAIEEDKKLDDAEPPDVAAVVVGVVVRIDGTIVHDPLLLIESDTAACVVANVVDFLLAVAPPILVVVTDPLCEAPDELHLEDGGHVLVAKMMHYVAVLFIMR